MEFEKTIKAILTFLMKNIHGISQTLLEQENG